MTVKDQGKDKKSPNSGKPKTNPPKDKGKACPVPVNQVQTSTTSTAPIYSMAPTAQGTYQYSSHSTYGCNEASAANCSEPFTGGLFGIVPFNSLPSSRSQLDSPPPSTSSSQANEAIMRKLDQMYSELRNMREMVARELQSPRRPQVASEPQLQCEKGTPPAPSQADIDQFGHLLTRFVQLYQSLHKSSHDSSLSVSSSASPETMSQLFSSDRQQQQPPSGSPTTPSSSESPLSTQLNQASELYQQAHQLGVDIYCQLLSAIVQNDPNQIPPNHPRQE